MKKFLIFGTSTHFHLWQELEAIRTSGLYEEAVASYHKAIQIKPDKDTVWSNRGNALLNLERYEEAVVSFDKAIQIKPDNDIAWNNRGKALFKLRKYREGFASIQKAIELNPEYQKAAYSQIKLWKKPIIYIISSLALLAFLAFLFTQRERLNFQIKKAD